MTPAFMHLALQKRKNEGIFRTLPLSQGRIDLTSNDYFGFARSPNLLECAQGAVSSIGATGSRLLTGNSTFYKSLEIKIAQFHHAESCLIYNSGYTANLGLIAALGTAESTFLYDLDIHASMIDGMRLSQGKSLPFRHNDLDSLEKRLQQATPPVFVLVESIYSINGDCAPLQDISSLCSHYNAFLIVDEAHATGVFGPNGCGYVSELHLESHVFARMHTFSKALGCHGACVLGSETLTEFLINFSRPFIYTTAMPLPSLSLIEAAYNKLHKEAHVHQRRLKALISYFQKKSGCSISASPIQPIYICDPNIARHLSNKLYDLGLDVRAILPPTTKKGKECLRVVLHSFNQEEEIDQLMEIINASK